MVATAPSAGGGSSTGQTLTPAQIIALWIKAGGSITSAPMALARALAESSGQTAVTSGNPDGGTNVGMWQLDTRGVGSGYSVSQLQNPLTNAQITVKATGNGANWSQWADNYGKFLNQANGDVAAFSGAAAGNSGGLAGYANDLLKGIEGIASAGAASAAAGVAGQLLQLPSQVTDFLTALEAPVQKLMWIVNPTSWARIIAGIFGFLLLGAGLITLGMAA